MELASSRTPPTPSCVLSLAQMPSPSVPGSAYTTEYGGSLNLCLGPTCALTLPSAYKSFVARSKPLVQGPSHPLHRHCLIRHSFHKLECPPQCPQPSWQGAWAAYAFRPLAVSPSPYSYIPSQGLRLPIWKGHVETPVRMVEMEVEESGVVTCARGQRCVHMWISAERTCLLLSPGTTDPAPSKSGLPNPIQTPV